MFKVLVTGGKGQLGSELRTLVTEYPDYQFIFIDRSLLDMSDLLAVKDYFVGKKFDAIINCGAYTAVDKAEKESVLADLINHQAVSVLSTIAKETKTKLIHISTDYVFNGKNYRPYLESDPTDPVSVYGKTKLDGEEAILAIAPENTIILRTSWVYSRFGSNFVKTMLRLGRERDSLGIIFDQVGTPTYAGDLAKLILEILPRVQNASPAIYHYSNDGVASWYDFAEAVFEFSKINCAVTPIKSEQYPTPATRPYYGILDKSKIKKDFDIIIPHWRNSLFECIKKLTEV